MTHSQTPAPGGRDPRGVAAQPEGDSRLDGPTPGAGEAAVGGAESDPAARIDELEAALAAAKTEASEHWDKFLRERADMENFKRRTERVYGDQSRRDRKAILLKFLGVLDNLERALAYDTAGGATDTQSLITGLRLTLSQFHDVLAGEGLTAVPAAGEPFDPALHEAVTTVPAGDRPEGEVVTELQKGYRYGEELLRPARVTVATRE